MNTKCNLLPLIGRRVIQASTDINNDVLMQFEDASFCFFGNHSIEPFSIHLNNLVGEYVTNAVREPFLLFLHFKSGTVIRFSWEGINNAEAYQGKIYFPDRACTTIVESSES
jgi:hypothetical protein